MGKLVILAILPRSSLQLKHLDLLFYAIGDCQSIVRVIELMAVHVQSCF